MAADDRSAALTVWLCWVGSGVVGGDTRSSVTFDRVRALAGQPRIMGPGQADLDAMVAAAITEAA